VLAVRDTGVGGRVYHSDDHHRPVLRRHHHGHLPQGGATATGADRTLLGVQQFATASLTMFLSAASNAATQRSAAVTL